jgi:hypothetical protein
MPFDRLLDPGDWLGMKPRIDPGTTPFEFHYSPDPGEIKLRVWVGGIVLVAASAAIYFAWGDFIFVLVAGGFAFFALLNLAYAALQSRFSYSLSITSFEVAVDRMTLFGPRHWRERLSAYRGVILREHEITEQSEGKITRTKRFHIIELLHDDPKKIVPLYVVEDIPAPHEIHAAYGRRFNLPLLTPDGDDLARADRPLRGPDPGPPPDGVLVREAGEVTCLDIRPGRQWRVFVGLFWLLLPLGIGLFLYQIDPEFGILAGGSAAALVIILLLADWLLNRTGVKKPAGLCISREAVWLGQPDSLDRASIPLGAVRQVRIDRTWSRSGGAGGARQHRLIVEGGNTRLEFGVGRSDRRKLDWIRGYLLHRISRRVS